MFTIKAISGHSADVFGYEATNFVVRKDRSVEFWSPSQSDSITLYPEYFERIVIENAAGRTVENVVAQKPTDNKQSEYAASRNT